MRWIMAMVLLAGPVQADPVDDVMVAAMRSFAQMPVVTRVGVIEGQCGADATVDAQVVYCTTRNEILITTSAGTLPQAPYLVAHAYGHAVQVRHGVADFALSQIRNRRSEEQMLRGLVEQQVDCIAGFLVARAGVPPVSLRDWMRVEPFTGIHWGRDPLHVGPSVSIGLDTRDEWFQRGQGGDLGQCAPGEFTADLLLTALQD